MDYGEEGLRETLNLCQRYKIVTVGAGKDIQQARDPVILELNGSRIGIIGYCETQFGIAMYNRAGVSPIEPNIYQAIQKLSKEVDIAILSLHGAAEICPWPSPKWQDLLRSFIDAGAKIIHGHHSHVPKKYEIYNCGYIFYGLKIFLI